MDPIFIPIVAILMPLGLVPTIIVLKHRHQRRQWEHQERMKAMETRLPASLQQVSAGGVAAIGAGVPMVAVLGAILAGLVAVDSGTLDESIPIHGIAWGCASMISAGAFVTSLLLYRMQARERKEAEAASSSMNDGKMVYDPDAFDVVSSRN
jgi:preprotein translocase subunit YajC